MTDGGPAFPYKGELKQHVGMSLLDYFAGQAIGVYNAADPNYTPEKEAASAYNIAEAMIAERERRMK